MADRNPPPYDDTASRKRSPAVNDIDPDGMDPESEGHELDTGAGDDSDDGVEPDGSRDDRRDDSASR